MGVVYISMSWEIQTLRIQEKTMVIKVVLKGLIEPKQLPELVKSILQLVDPHDVDVVVISGRLPVWAFSTISVALSTTLHRVKVAVADPKLAGAVVVTPPAEGEVIPLPPEAF